MLLEKGAKAEISEIFERCNITPKIQFTTWDEYAIMSMVESGLGISILPELILKRIPYRVVVKELDIQKKQLAQLGQLLNYRFAYILFLTMLLLTRALLTKTITMVKMRSDLT